MITAKTKEAAERIKATTKVRECRERYLIYFAYTSVKIPPQKYKEKQIPSIITIYDVFSSDSIDDIRDHRDLLLSIMEEDNSYVLVIVDRLESKIIKKVTKLINIDNLISVLSKSGVPNYILQSNFKYSIRDYIHKKKIYPVIGYDRDNKLAELDFFFRSPGEIPEDYKWDVGEYEGWLQYRWGDGLNKIDYGKE